MALSAFDDQSAPPSPDALKQVLGKTAALWTSAPRDIGKRIGKVATVWGFSGKSTGWGLRVKRGDRVIAYIIPCAGPFLASFELGADRTFEQHRDLLHFLLFPGVLDGFLVGDELRDRFADRIHDL